MADISKCRGMDCPIKEECYRYTAPKGYWQSYLFGIPYNWEKKECRHYWKNEEDLEINKSS